MAGGLRITLRGHNHALTSKIGFRSNMWVLTINTAAAGVFANAESPPVATRVRDRFHHRPAAT
jgi:hypothetical protein